MRSLPIHSGAGDRLVRWARHAGPPGRRAGPGVSVLLSERGLGETADADDVLPESPDLRVVVAPRFGAEVLSSAFRRGVLLVPLVEPVVAALAAWADANPGVEIGVDLEAQRLEVPGLGAVPFATHPALRDRLLLGLDDLDEIRRHGAEVAAFRDRYRARRPWLDPAAARGE